MFALKIVKRLAPIMCVYCYKDFLAEELLSLTIPNSIMTGVL